MSGCSWPSWRSMRRRGDMVKLSKR